MSIYYKLVTVLLYFLVYVWMFIETSVVPASLARKDAGGELKTTATCIVWLLTVLNFIVLCEFVGFRSGVVACHLVGCDETSWISRS